MTEARLTCSAAQFEEIRRHPLLPTLLRLARAVNALRALRTAFVPSDALSLASQIRQQRNVMLHLGATLYEALGILDDLGQAFGQLPEVRLHLLPIRRSADWQDLRVNVLKPIRDTAAFHFDPDVLPRALAELSQEEFVLATSTEVDKAGRCYPLADEALIPAAFRDGRYADHQSNYMRYLNDTLVYAGYFCRAVDAVLASVGPQLGFVAVPSGDADSSGDVAAT